MTTRSPGTSGEDLAEAAQSIGSGLRAVGCWWTRRERLMSTEQNTALVRRYFSKCVSGLTGPDHEGAPSLVDELMSADFTMAYSHEARADAARRRERHEDLIGHAEAFPASLRPNQ